MPITETHNAPGFERNDSRGQQRKNPMSFRPGLPDCPPCSTDSLHLLEISLNDVPWLPVLSIDQRRPYRHRLCRPLGKDDRRPIGPVPRHLTISYDTQHFTSTLHQNRHAAWLDDKGASPICFSQPSLGSRWCFDAFTGQPYSNNSLRFGPLIITAQAPFNMPSREGLPTHPFTGQPRH